MYIIPVVVLTGDRNAVCCRPIVYGRIRLKTNSFIGLIIIIYPYRREWDPVFGLESWLLTD